MTISETIASTSASSVVEDTTWINATYEHNLVWRLYKFLNREESICMQTMHAASVVRAKEQLICGHLLVNTRMWSSFSDTNKAPPSILILDKPESIV